MMKALRNHWPEYLMEAVGLGLFMVSAGVFTTLFEYPGSPIHRAISSALLRRGFIGFMMGATATGLIYSPWGQQSGAHYNPAVTLSFLRLGRVRRLDALFYIVSQFLGALCGVVLVAALLGDRFRQAPVSYIATLPGPGGRLTAFLAEVLISFCMMATVLIVSSVKAVARYTGMFAGFLVFIYITIEAPMSGMSMNPARTFASAAPTGDWGNVWIYFTAPVLGMLLAVEANRALRGRSIALCAKLHHQNSRRCIHCRLSALALLLVLGVSTLPAQLHPSGVGPIVVVVGDLDRSIEFYTDVLSFRKEFEKNARSDSFDRLVGVFGTNVRVAGLALGEESIELVEFRTPQGRPVPVDSHSDDRWFQHIAIVVRDMEAASSRLRAHKVRQISTAPQILPDWNPNAAGIKAFYFYDPDDHPLELISFPLDKGDARWHQIGPGSRMFLGIDHTAIAVKDTDRSIAFYRDLLGFRIVGESLNYGPEQEQLNHVFGSRVRITSLRAPAGPGIEFLEYVTPQTGRPFPSETKVNDLWSSETTVVAEDLRAAVAELMKRRVTFISSEPAAIAPLGDPTAKGVLIRDPDGHTLLLRSLYP